MRNVFDQYTQPENRLSHALASVLLEDAGFRKSFVRWVGLTPPPRAADLRVLEQGVGGIAGETGKQRHLGLPDCIFHVMGAGDFTSWEPPISRDGSHRFHRG